ncbi:MAG: hypothetical protein DRQ49_19130 [Gammaproteobacteria bacterium]|nr:MAG: hypothetical protein DRQ49_19130 [Gammaproteobacteria bacterium]
MANISADIWKDLRSELKIAFLSSDILPSNFGNEPSGYWGLLFYKKCELRVEICAATKNNGLESQLRALPKIINFNYRGLSFLKKNLI